MMQPFSMGMMPGMMPGAFMNPMITPPIFPMGQPGHMYNAAQMNATPQQQQTPQQPNAGRPQA